MYDQLGCGKSFVEGHPELWTPETWLNELCAPLVAKLSMTAFLIPNGISSQVLATCHLPSRMMSIVRYSKNGLQRKIDNVVQLAGWLFGCFVIQLFSCLVVWLYGCMVDWYCLPDSRLSLSCNPETSSRVTLAALGIGFQPKLPIKNYTTRQLNNYTTIQQDN